MSSKDDLDRLEHDWALHIAWRNGQELATVRRGALPSRAVPCPWAGPSAVPGGWRLPDRQTETGNSLRRGRAAATLDRVMRAQSGAEPGNAHRPTFCRSSQR
jgi:hypothetical protein